MRKTSLLIISIFLFLFSNSQTYTASSGTSIGAISPAGVSPNPNYYPLAVSGLPNNGIINGTYGLYSATINIKQPYDADLIISLIAPDGTTVLLSNQNGSSGQNYTGTVFINPTQPAGGYSTINLYSISSAGTLVVPPFTGTYLPESGNLGAVNDNQNGNGTWQLEVQDLDSLAANAGAVTSWSLTFNNTPAPVPPTRPTCTGTTIATKTCVDAPFVCNLNGFCGSTYDNTANNDVGYTWPQLVNTFANCQNSSIQNNSFVRFVAGATSATFDIWVYNSRDGNGIQMLFFNDVCGSGAVTSYGCAHQIPIQSTPYTLSATGLTVGQTYYLMFDGYSGDVCDYTIQATSGVNVLSISLNPDSVTVCRGTNITMQGTSGSGTSYSWASSTYPTVANPNAALSSTTDSTVILNTGALPTNVTIDTVTLTGTAVGSCPATATSVFHILNEPNASSIATTQTGLVGFTANALSVTSTTPGVTYQWYESSSDSYSGIPLKGDTLNTFTPPTNAVGTFYYYCLVSNGICKTPSLISTVIVTTGPPCANPDTLAFVQQPTTTPQSSAMNPAVTVKVFCTTNGINYSPNTYSGLVTLTAKDGCGYISQTVKAVNGLATFDSVIFSRSVQNGVSLVATAVGINGSITSDTFSITPPVATTITTYGPGKWSTIITENFSGTNPSAWYANDTTDDPTQKYNFFTQLANTNATWAAVRTCVGCKERKSTAENPTYVSFPTVSNLAQYDTVYFTFSLAAVNTTYDSTAAQYYQYMSAADSTDVQVSFDGGTTWQTVLLETGVGAQQTNGGRKFVGIGDINPADTALTLGNEEIITTADLNSYFVLLVSSVANPVSQFRFKLNWTDNDEDKEWAFMNPTLIGKKNGVKTIITIPAVPQSYLPTLTVSGDTAICSPTTTAGVLTSFFLFLIV